MTARPERHDDAYRLADRIIEETGGDVRLGLPLGLGKAPHVANALFERARGDPSIRLTIFTALTLEAPSGAGDLERRLIDPMAARLFAGWPRLAYAEALRGDGLPPNIEVSEFFLQAGAWLSNDQVQQAYTAINYSRAAPMLRAAKINVVAQLVAPDPDGGDRLSLSSNPDLTLDLMDIMRSQGGPCLLVGQTNAALPFMPGDAALPESDFDHILAGEALEFPLFAPPNQPVSAAEHAIGLRIAAMVPDGGTVQIGIGSTGDALCAALIMRHRAPALFRETLDQLGVPAGADRHDAPFEEGLYGVSEMFAPGFMELFEAGILKRRAADGAVLHAAFFLGPEAFYHRLREAPAEERALFQMRPISFTNTLAGDRAAKLRDRRDARFVNNAMAVSLLGDVASDTLEDGRVVSGVGGQHDFVMQALDLPGGRALIALTATREAKGETRSRIAMDCGRATLPRHLRDVIVTEYGRADLRNRSDAQCIAAMIAIADDRFREGLIVAATRAGKLPEGGAGAGEPANTPERIETALAPARRAGWCEPFPFGTDLGAEERRLLGPLKRLRGVAAHPLRLARFAAAAAFERAPSDDEAALLARLSLAQPATLRERLTARMVLRAVRAGGEERGLRGGGGGISPETQERREQDDG